MLEAFSTGAVGQVLRSATHGACVIVKNLMQRFLELIRFSHTIFALPFALLSCVWALAAQSSGQESQLPFVGWRLLGVLLCMVFARSAAMAFNRLVDVKFDAANPRTASRHLPAGELTEPQVWVFFAAAALSFVASCLLFLPNGLPLAFALPVLAWICGYSFAKRFTAAAHLWLGAALALSPICAWIALRGEAVMSDPADLLPSCGIAFAITLWVAGFDTIYACQDAQFDRQLGLHSLPSRFGIPVALKISAGLHAAMLLVFGCLPFLFPQLSLGWIYWIALTLVAGLVIRQHWLVSPDDLTRVNVAFFNINAIISFTLSAAAGTDALLR